MPDDAPLRGSLLTLRVPRDLELATTFCSYGYFLLAPNRWDKKKQHLERVFRGERGKRIVAVVSQPAAGRLRIVCDRKLTRGEGDQLKGELGRMLRMDEDVRPWWSVHREAKLASYGRMSRSPDLWEDIVKTITGCNVTWRNTMTMNRLLCEKVGGGAFPRPVEIADLGEERLKAQCKVGYRAGRIVKLAQDILDATVDLAWFEAPERTSDEVYEALLKLHGIGPYAAANITHLLGHYDRLAIDTETYRHYCKLHKIERPKNPAALHPEIEAYYDRFGDYRFKAYWYELWRDYERRYGPAYTWDQDEEGRNFTAAVLAD